MEEIQISTERWMDNQNVVYTYNGISFSLKKEGNSEICYNMDEPWGHYAKWNTNTVWSHIYDVPRVVIIIETKNRMLVSKGQGEGEMGSYFLICIAFQFCKSKSSGDRWWWWLPNNMNVLNTTELYVYLKWLR